MSGWIGMIATLADSPSYPAYPAGGRLEPGCNPLAWRLVVFLLIVKIVGITFALHLI
jgi:hypothetical protein